MYEITCYLYDMFLKVKKFEHFHHNYQKTSLLKGDAKKYGCSMSTCSINNISYVHCI